MSQPLFWFLVKLTHPLINCFTVFSYLMITLKESSAIILKGELFLSIAKRAYRHLQSHPYFAISMLSFYLVYFIIAFAIALLVKQFSVSSVQLNRIIATLVSQQDSLNSEPFKVLEAITAQYIAEYRHILMLLGIVGALILLTIQLGLSQVRKKEYQTYLLMGERVYKLTAQLVMEQLLLINSVLLLILTFYSLFTTPIMNQVAQIEAASLQSEFPTDPTSYASQEQAPSSKPDPENETFTRFTIDPFLKGAFASNKFSQNNTLQALFVILVINLSSGTVIGVPNYIILSLKKNKFF